MDSMKLAEMYKYFLAQYITYCNGKWYCNLCKVKNLTDIYSHLQEVHPDITSLSRYIPISDSQNKSIELSDTKCRELLNRGILINMSQNYSTLYFCVSCKCSIYTLDNVYEHLKGRKHQTCTSNVAISDDTNEQQKSSENINGKQSIVSVNIKTQTEVESKSEIQLNCEDKLGKDHSTKEAIFSSSSSDSETKEEEKRIVYEKDKNSNNILQIERSVNMCFCTLCDAFMHKCFIEEHVRHKRHVSATSALKTKQQAIYIINLEKDRKIIKPLKLNSRKLDGTVWPECITTLKTRNYITCDRCNEKIEKNNIINHEVAVHKSKIIFSNDSHVLNEENINTCDIPFYYPMFKCSFCNGIIHGLSLLRVHFSKCRHKENMKLLTEIKKQEYNSSKNIESFFELLEFLNLISFENNGNTVQIMEQPVMYIKNHRKSFHDLNQNHFTYICIVCKCKFDAIEDVIDHLCKKKKHLEHFQNILLTYNHIHSISVTKELGTNKTQPIESPICTEDILIDILKECNINETLIVQHIGDNSDLIAKTNTDSTADTLSQSGESNSGLFVSPVIYSEINQLITNKLIIKPIERNTYKLQREQKKNNVLDRYNRMYYKRFLDFEKIMFTCNQKKLDEIKLSLQLYAFKYENMHCLACNVTHSYNQLYEHIYCEQHIMRFTQLHTSSENQRLKLLKELIEINSTNLRCHACNKNEKLHDKSNIEKHMYYPVHKKNRKKVLEKAMCMLEDFNTLWYNIRYFACVECKARFQMKIEFMEHLAKHNKLLSTKDNSKFDFCLTCATLWYNNGDSVYQRHCRKETHRYLARSNDFAIMSLPDSLQELLRDINGTVVNLFKLSNDIWKDSRTIQLVDALKHTFEAQHFYVGIYMFGSRITGLALPNSDIDLYLDFSKLESTSVNYINTYCDEAALILQNRSKQIQKCLQADSENWEIELILDKSRTPVIKVKHRLTGLQCDISYTNGLSIENSKLIKSFNTTYPLCRKLILFLKKWILLGNLTGSDGITNYSLTWLVIFYLQVKYKIPSIATLIKKHNHSKIICGWETGVGNIVPINVPELNTPIHTLLLGFFEYYEHFDYIDDVICPLLGKTCRKEIFTEQSSSLPDTMKRYITQLLIAKPEYFRIDSPMCVQDPFDLSHNLTKAVPILTLKRFKQYCKESASMLRNVNGQVCRKKDT